MVRMLRVNRKAVALFIVLAVLMIAIILAVIILRIMSSQSRLTHHQVSRIQAYFACQAGMNYALDMLRIGTYIPNGAGGPNKYACLNGCVDSGITADYTIPPDSAIPFSVQVTIYPLQSGTTRLDIRTRYTYTAP